MPGIVQVYVLAYAQPPWNEQNNPIASESYLRWAMRHPNTYCLVAVIRPASPSAVPTGDPLPGDDPIEVHDRVVGFVLAGERDYAAFVEDWERLAERPAEGWPIVLGRLGYIWEIAVHPQAQRRGIGSALLAAAIDQLRRDGVQRLLLRSSERAPAAIALYHRFGFWRLPLRERRDPLAGPWLLDLT